jgi:hypothetical protein
VNGRTSTPADLEDVERHEHRRRAEGAGVRIAEQMEAAHELLVEDSDLAISTSVCGRSLPTA